MLGAATGRRAKVDGTAVDVPDRSQRRRTDPLMHLARTPEACQDVKGVVTLASQATEAAGTPSARLRIVGAAALNNVLGYLPGPALGLGPEREYRGVMNQWFRWNWTGRWLGRDGFDYAEALRGVDVPLLSLAGAGDRFIAPVHGCHRLYELAGSHDKRFVVCGKDSGFAEDYGHTRIIASRAAWQQIWPMIPHWMRERPSGWILARTAVSTSRSKPSETSGELALSCAETIHRRR
jgi:pimeloyl-ACP methyl ester carboxylesterase